MFKLTKRVKYDAAYLIHGYFSLHSRLFSLMIIISDEFRYNLNHEKFTCMRVHDNLLNI